MVLILESNRKVFSQRRSKMTKFIIIVLICCTSIASFSAEKKEKKPVSFANCTEARAAGYEDIKKGEPGYAPKLDRDKDGVACESK